MPHLRARLALALLSAATITAGLASRIFLDGPLAKHPGVALWATLVYCLILLARPTTRVRTAALVTLALSWSVELAQLTPLPAWLSSQHTLLRLVFGTTYHAADLPSYAAGVLLAAGIHALLLSRPSHSPQPQPVYPPEP